MAHKVAHIKSCVTAFDWVAHTCTQGNRAGTLEEMEQNRPFSREQNHSGEEACIAYWYSLQLILMDTDPLPEPGLTQGKAEKTRDREHRGAHRSFKSKSRPNISSSSSHLHPTAARVAKL